MSDDNSGLVYFISAYHMLPCGYFKVGITRCESHKTRIRQIQSNSPFYIVTSCVVEDDNPEELEQAILHEFRRYRIRGEWFAVIPHYHHEYDKDTVIASRKFELDVIGYMKKNCSGDVVVGGDYER
jgi:hypothetical protein